MDNEKLTAIELSDSDLDQIWGGQGGKNGAPKCAAYQYRGQYTSCPNPFMGICKQCPKCELNVG